MTSERIHVSARDLLCPWCRSSITEVAGGDGLTVCACKTIVHDRCLAEWGATCPTCKQPLAPRARVELDPELPQRIARASDELGEVLRKILPSVGRAAETFENWRAAGDKLAALSKLYATCPDARDGRGPRYGELARSCRHDEEVCRARERNRCPDGVALLGCVVAFVAAALAWNAREDLFVLLKLVASAFAAIAGLMLTCYGYGLIGATDRAWARRAPIDRTLLRWWPQDVPPELPPSPGGSVVAGSSTSVEQILASLNEKLGGSKELAAPRVEGPKEK